MEINKTCLLVTQYSHHFTTSYHQEKEAKYYFLRLLLLLDRSFVLLLILHFYKGSPAHLLSWSYYGIFPRSFVSNNFIESKSLDISQSVQTL